MVLISIDELIESPEEFLKAVDDKHAEAENIIGRGQCAVYVLTRREQVADNFLRARAVRRIVEAPPGTWAFQLGAPEFPYAAVKKLLSA